MQQPFVQVLFAQHGPAVEAVAPAVPQVTQRELLQTVFASVQVLLAQHGPPAEPQIVQMLLVLSQTVPGSLHAVVVDVELEQQDWPVAPHSLHA
jgi:hypothetical protein